MYPVLLSLGPLVIHSFGLMVALAFLAGIASSIYFATKAGIKSEAILDLALYVIIAAIIGARGLYVLGEWETYRANPLDIIMVQKGGLAFLGGLILAIAVVIYYAKIKAIPLLKLLDVLTPGTALGYVLGRIGCFLNGCCFGHPTHSIFGVKFPPGSLAYFQYPDVPVHPTQLYALVSILGAFLVMLWFWPRKKYDGQIFFWGLIMYSVYRFVVEYFRFCPDELYWLGLNPGQFISLALLVIGLLGIYQAKKHS